jgi:alanine dehydrogenase
MPGAVPRTSTFALTNTTLHHVEAIAELGPAEAVRRDPSLRLGANVWQGELVCQGVAESIGLPWKPLEATLGS